MIGLYCEFSMGFGCVVLVATHMNVLGVALVVFMRAFKCLVGIRGGITVMLFASVD